MPVVGFDDNVHRGFFDLSELESLEELFAEVLTEIRGSASSGRRRGLSHAWTPNRRCHA
jgi:hypothetical protein